MEFRLLHSYFIRARLVCIVSKGQEPKRPGPFASSRHDEIQFEFRDGGCNEVNNHLRFYYPCEKFSMFQVFTFN